MSRALTRLGWIRKKKTVSATERDGVVRRALSKLAALIDPFAWVFWHLPPYSPDFNPIEEAFSKVKQFLRRAQARIDDALPSATWAALASITLADIAGWSSHCGYGAGDQQS